MNYLGVIPARGGSKGVPGKNIAEVAGKPLIAWTIEAAEASRGLTRCIASNCAPIQSGVGLPARFGTISKTALGGQCALVFRSIAGRRNPGIHGHDVPISPGSWSYGETLLEADSFATAI